ncbi:MAG: DKNYY domain-containing protein [Bacteroidetes bacterium]|nr:DKNYY domain-containing protein [Bacteroidota bacterium]
MKKVNINAYKPIKQGFSKDDKQIFYLDKKMPISDYPSFEIVQLPYSKDNYRAYFRDFIIENQTQKPLNFKFRSSCSCDTTHAYFKNEIIKKSRYGKHKKRIACNWLQ